MCCFGECSCFVVCVSGMFVIVVLGGGAVDVTRFRMMLSGSSTAGMSQITSSSSSCRIVVLDAYSHIPAWQSLGCPMLA